MFTHEKLRVYQESIQFLTSIDETLESLPKGIAVRSQIERASTSIPLNIAEGNGKFTEKDKCRFLDIARGSAMECAASVDVLVAKGHISKEKGSELKQRLDRIVSMLVCMIRSLSLERSH